MSLKHPRIERIVRLQSSDYIYIQFNSVFTKDKMLEYISIYFNTQELNFITEQSDTIMHNLRVNIELLPIFTEKLPEYFI